MHKVIILASSFWSVPEPQQQIQLEKNYLKLENYQLTETLEGNEVQAIWFCSSPVVQDTIEEFMIFNNNANIKFITLPPCSLENYPSCDDTTISLQEITNNSVKELEEEFWIYQLPDEIDAYLSKHFPDALEIIPPSALKDLPIWFMSNISNERLNYLEENNLLNPYIEQFPPVFQDYAKNLLATCFEHYSIGNTWGSTNNYKLDLLCFAKLLHGFVCVSQWDSNQFDVLETAKSLDIDNLYLGSLLSPDMTTEIYGNTYANNFEPKSDALDLITTDKINNFTKTLCKHIGETHFFAMLWWCIWPDHSRSVYANYDSLFNEFNLNDEATAIKMEIFQLLQDGWSDYIDMN
ncbi:MAG: hypothetical protein L3J59_11690 [Methylococcaceae bacterium]|nr:hypothetical protein [Methylococcaceae bacterium]